MKTILLPLQKSKFLLIILQLVMVMIFATTAWCGMIINAEPDGVQTTAVSSAVTFDFDSLLQNSLLTNVAFNFGSITGTYDKLYIREPNQYGGANGTQYPGAATSFGTNPYTLTLSQPVNYFGMFWSAGDSGNVLTFYLGSNEVASYVTSTALGLLPPAYWGNPNNGLDSNEPFAYLNFFGTNGTTFDKIVFAVNTTWQGLESDNHAILQNAQPLTDGGRIDLNPVPEPTSMLLLGLGLMGLAGIRRKIQQ